MRAAGWTSLAVGVVLVALLVVPPAAGAMPDRFRIDVVSGRADLISGGRALVEIKLPARVNPDRVRVWLRARGRARNVTNRFAIRPDGRYMGNVVVLRNGENRLTVRHRGKRKARRTIINHPVGGPLFSGPQIQPWECQEGAEDERCNQRRPEFELFYRPTGFGDPTSDGLEPYDRANPPDDVAMTTTDEGVTVPFIVRIETGYQNRDQYKIATLFEPGKPWRPWRPQRQWNHKLLITHGGDCGVNYRAGRAPSVTHDGTVPGTSLPRSLRQSPTLALGRGFMVMSTALNNTGHNCNLVVGAESMVMAKERIVESYGPIRYTIGIGCSGGSIEAQAVANAYPGIYQGIVVACSYPDIGSPGAQFADLSLMRPYFEDPSAWGPGVVWSPTQWAAVEGHIAHLNAIASDEFFFNRVTDPTHPCGGTTDEQRYHPERNPGGVRCSLLDYVINVLGPRPRREWTAAERRRGRGFGGVPITNVGKQYGLAALRRGEITPAQFVDLNAKVGGHDIDFNHVEARTRGHRRTLRNLYRTGALNRATHLDQVAIIDHGGPDPGAAHDARWAWVVRQRIERQHGHSRNHVIWFGQTPLIGDQHWFSEALLAMDRWLSMVERDRSRRPLATKIVDNRPLDLEDRCSQLPVVELVEVPGIGKVCELDLVQTRLGTPSTVAGEGFATTTNRCRLKPLDRGEYGGIQFTAAQWAQLEETFADGVCDWSDRGVGERVRTIPWLTYHRRDRDRVRHGGRPLGPAPKASATGWTSPPFGEWRRAGR